MSRPSYTNDVEDVRVSCILGRMSSPVDTPAMEEISRKIIPYLADLLTLESGDEEHPSVRQVFKCLVDPQLTMHEYVFVIGPLAQYIFEITDGYRLMGFNYLGRVAAEALAVKNPTVLEGSWETAAWFIVRLLRKYYSDDFGFASDHLSDWIIRVVGDPDLCPNSYLRLELMHLLLVMVDVKDYNRTQAFVSVMSACSAVNMDYLSCDPENEFFNMDLNGITYILEKVTEDDHIFDENLANKLSSVKTYRISAVIQDVAYNHSVHTNGYTGPSELQGLVALLNIVKNGIKQANKTIDEHLYEEFNNLLSISRWFRES